MRIKQWFFIFLGILIVWFLYIERSILNPFIIAAIFAYIFNPLINFSSKKLHIPRTMIIFIVYTIILAIIILVGAILVKRVSQESIDITRDINNTIDSARFQLYTLPNWLRPAASDFLLNLRNSKIINLVRYSSVVPVFSQAISKIIGFFIFLFSGFYFLKDGESIFKQFLQLIPENYRNELETLLGKINAVLGGYLRGQMFLVFVMSVMIYIALSILGVKFALSLAIFSGFAEIVPVIGPIMAGGIATIVALVTGSSNFGLLPLQTSLIVILVYFVLRQLEDYFIVPHVMGKITQLPPIIIFFAVISGGHLAGVLGLILAVPVAGIIRLLLEFSIEKLSAEGKNPRK